MRKTRILVNKTVCLDLSILYLSKVWLCKTKTGENAKFCYTDIDRFIVHVKTNDICKDIAEDLEKSSGTTKN